MSAENLPVDRAMALEKLMNNAELHQTLCGMFLQRYADAETVFSLWQTEEQMAAARLLAHSLVSAASMIGANQLSILARQFETALRKQELEQCPACSEAVRTELAKVMVCVRELYPA